MKRCGLSRAATGAPDAVPRSSEHPDAWHPWLLEARHGSDPDYATALAPMLADFRDRVLDRAGLRAGCVVADIGTGDGLVAFGAFAREPSIEMTFVDISPTLIDYVAARATALGLASRSRFVVASVENLSAIADASVDCVTVRAVFAYVADKAAAISECYRILRPGGRISIVDPIFQDRAYALAGVAAQLRTGDNGPAATYLDFLHRIGRSQFPDSVAEIARDRLTNYNERDLYRHFENAGFVDIRLRLHIDGRTAIPMPWPVFLRTSVRAGTPTVGEVLATEFSPAERVAYERLFRPAIEAGTGGERTANAYISANRP